MRRRSAHRILVGTLNDPSALAALEAFPEFGRVASCGAPTRLIGSVAYSPETYGESAVFTRHRLINPKNVNKVYPNDLPMSMRPLPWSG